jgi:prepilin-type N-terminal cleavage/methylation domain-containing protein
MTKTNSSKRGFTLLEILLVVGIIAILAGIVILAINPTKQLGDARNAQRRSDVLTILNALYQFSLDNDGAMPPTLEDDDQDDTDCAATIGIDALTLDGADDLNVASSTYLTAIPTDPTAADKDAASEYRVVRRTSGRVTVCAPNSVGEGSITEGNQIEVTR